MASKDEKIQKALGTLRSYRVVAYKGASVVASDVIEAKNEDRAIAKLKASMMSRNKSILGLTYRAERAD